MTLSRTTLYGIGAAALAATLALLLTVNFTGDGENGGTGPFVVTAIVAGAIGLFLFGWYAPRAERPVRAGIAAGVLGLLALPAFWSGLPLVLGAAAAALGAGARERTRGATAAIVLGVAAFVLGVAGTIFDYVSWERRASGRSRSRNRGRPRGRPLRLPPPGRSGRNRTTRRRAGCRS